MNMRKITAFVLFLILMCIAVPHASRGQDNKAGEILASRLLGRDVYDANRQLIGEVDDIILNRNGHIKKLTMEFGGILDIGDKLVSLPFRNFSMSDEGIILQATQEQLQERSEYDYAEEGLRPEYYYRSRPYMTPYYSYPQRYYGRYYRDWPGRGYYAGDWAYSPGRYLASVLMDRRIIDENGRDIGILEDLVLDSTNKQVKTILVSRIEYLEEDAYVALPFKPLGFTSFGILYEEVPRDLKRYTYSNEED
ncbi:MAG: PRC-barrel domain-containing protein [Syntrophales bacterium]|jgi:sporulation protein YlmC with PRC-barrel domain|nr:PRC-barrel domain-containing protein [Syntrophales bacterium]MDY0044659.1 PRC-barrel domain-containing protein [Syntrophales bacterium]